MKKGGEDPKVRRRERERERERRMKEGRNEESGVVSFPRGCQFHVVSCEEEG